MGVFTVRVLIIGTLVNVVVIALLLTLISTLEMVMKITGGVGTISWVLAGILSGAFISGDRTRANNNIETTEDNKSRNKFTSIFFIIGIPYLITALIIYFITR
jgi:hypothetical protein